MVGIEEQSHNITAEDIYFNIGLQEGDKPQLHQPESCPHCGEEHIKGIEVLGATEGVLYWECSHCLECMPRFTKEKTIRFLQKTQELFIDLERLAYIWEELPN